MDRKNLNEKDVTDCLIEKNYKGVLCAMLNHKGFSFSHGEIDNILDNLEKRGIILKYNTRSGIEYIRADRVDLNKNQFNNQKQNYFQEDKK